MIMRQVNVKYLTNLNKKYKVEEYSLLPYILDIILLKVEENEVHIPIGTRVIFDINIKKLEYKKREYKIILYALFLL